MTEAEWLRCEDPEVMLRWLHASDARSDRKLRLFAVACCRHTDDTNRSVLEAAELQADGVVSWDEFRSAYRAAEMPSPPVYSLFQWWCDAGLAADNASFDAAWMASNASPEEGAFRQERRAQCSILRDIFANPFRDASVHPARLKAKHGLVRKLAQVAYDERTSREGTLDPAHLAALADALEEVGGANPDILGHLRGPGPHFLGCWVLDALLDKT